MRSVKWCFKSLQESIAVGFGAAENLWKTLGYWSVGEDDLVVLGDFGEYRKGFLNGITIKPTDDQYTIEKTWKYSTFL